MDLRRTEASALFSPSSTSTSTTPSRKNSPRLHAPITATHAYVIAGDKYGEKYDKKDRNDVEIIGVKDNKVLNVLSGSTGSEVEVEGEEGKVLKKSTVATVSPALSSAYSATSVDSDDDIISGEYRGVERGGGREGGVGGGGKGRGGQKDDEYDGIKVHGPTLLGSARSAQLHAMYTSSESKGKGDEKGKVRGEKKEEGKGERKEGKGEGKGDEKGEWMEEMEKGEGKEEMKAEAKEQGHTHDSHETDVVWLKSVNGIETKVIGGSHIFNNTHITQLEAVSRLMLSYVILCYIMLCCVVLCCVVLCYVVM